jgi:hypothetical protein
MADTFLIKMNYIGFVNLIAIVMKYTIFWDKSADVSEEYITSICRIEG